MKKIVGLFTCLILTLTLILPAHVNADNSASNYHYNQLDEVGKTIYDYLDNPDNADIFTSEEETCVFSTQYSGTDIDSYFNGITISASNAYTAYGIDHPEIFWISSRSERACRYNSSDGKNYNIEVYFTFFIADSWSEGERNIDNDSLLLDNAVNEIVKEASKKSTTYDKLAYIHDWLTENNIYNTNVYKTNENVENTNVEAVCFTAIGALDQSVNPVCEGYAEAFKIICDRLNIPCLIVTGNNHMWNYVQVDGVWYGMDVTYDDPMGIDAALSGLENRNHFLVGSETKADGVNTFIDAHPPYKFNYPTLSKTAYDPKNSGWLEDSVGWRYRRGDGSYSENKWEQIDGTWYHFDKSGYMQTGWQKIGGVWYFFNESGAMRTGWVYDGSNWYYMSPSGAMMTGWVQDGSTWYYLKGSGAMAANEYVGGYWLNPSGSWTYQHRASWHKSGDRWWYGDTSGWYARNATYKIDGVYYGFDAEGWMK